MPDITPNGLETTFTREEILKARASLRLKDRKGVKKSAKVSRDQVRQSKAPVVLSRKGSFR